MKTINKENYKTHVKSWCPDIEDSAMEQIDNLAQLPFVFKHVAIMSDSHAGMGCPIGTVLATKDIIIPNIVGVDIGCGVIAVKTSLKEISQEQIKKIFGGSKEYQGGIRAVVPVGMSKQSKAQCYTNIPMNLEREKIEEMPIVKSQWSSLGKQIGTLGGGK